MKSTKWLGLIVDDELSFGQHAAQKLKECNKKWGLLTKTTTRNHGLNVRSLTLLLKTVVLTKLFYASPLWLGKHMDYYKKFWNKVIMKISGAMVNPHRELAELTLHLPPLEVQLETLTVKFLCKSLTSKDFVTSVLLQVDGTLQSEFHPQLNAIKKYLAWKDEGKQRAREIELSDLKNQQLAQYDKAEIEAYQQKIWMDRIQNRIQIRHHSSENDEKVLNVIKKVEATKVQLNKDNSLFNKNTTKKEDSVIMDYIHGSSLIFGNMT